MATERKHVSESTGRRLGGHGRAREGAEALELLRERLVCACWGSSAWAQFLAVHLLCDDALQVAVALWAIGGLDVACAAASEESG